jgi:hypothetical protein
MARKLLPTGSRLPPDVPRRIPAAVPEDAQVGAREQLLAMDARFRAALQQELLREGNRLQCHDRVNPAD